MEINRAATRVVCGEHRGSSAETPPKTLNTLETVCKQPQQFECEMKPFHSPHCSLDPTHLSRDTAQLSRMKTPARRLCPSKDSLPKLLMLSHGLPFPNSSLRLVLVDSTRIKAT